MKKIMVLLIAMTAVGSASAQIQDFYSTTYFHTNVYLSDNTNVSIRARIPTGNLMRVQSDNVIAPSGNLIVDGGFELRTNRQITMQYKPAVDAMQTGVVINANGYITLNHFVTGVGWTNKVLNPTNLVLRNETFPGGAYTETDPLYTNDLVTTITANLIVTTNQDVCNILKGNFASGSGTASGNFRANASGSSTTASGDYGANANGYIATASGDYGANANGYSTTASGANGANANGRNAQALGESSTALGTDAIASAIYAQAFGHSSVASNSYSFVWSDGVAYGSHDTNAFNVHARGGIYLEGGPIYGNGSSITGCYAQTLVFTNTFTGGVMSVTSTDGTNFFWR